MREHACGSLGSLGLEPALDLPRIGVALALVTGTAVPDYDVASRLRHFAAQHVVGTGSEFAEHVINVAYYVDSGLLLAYEHVVFVHLVDDAVGLDGAGIANDYIAAAFATVVVVMHVAAVAAVS